MRKLLARLSGLRLQVILVLGFVLTTAVTIGVGTRVIYTLINNYLESAAVERVARDMDLAQAFLGLKRADLESTAARLAVEPRLGARLTPGAGADAEATISVDARIDSEFAGLSSSQRRFVVVTNSEGLAVLGRTCCGERMQPQVVPNSRWSTLPIVESALRQGQALSGAEVLPAGVLGWVGLEEQAHITLIDTPKAAPEPFNPLEGTAGLVLVSVAPVTTREGEVLGAVVVGHLFNNDYTLVDRIKQVAGVDTVTIFLGDLRVSTNVPKEDGTRAIGTRLAQEVFDRVLVQGEEYTGTAYVVNQEYIARYDPLHDFTGKVVGILYVGASKAAFLRLVEQFGFRVQMTAVASLALAILIAVPVAWIITRPLAVVAGATRRVAQGDWAVRTPVRGPREFRTLSESFNTMVETLIDTRDQLVQKEKLASVGQLAAGVAHEINNPLGSVLLYADIMRKETPEENTQQREDLELIIREATRCKTIVTDLLNFSRQNEVMAQETDLNRLILEILDEAGRKAVFERVEFVADLEPSLPSIQADPLQLQQVFLNLMNNAAEAMPGGGKLTLRTRKGSLPGYVTVEVQDTGVGIPPEHMKRLFTPFFTTKPIGKGTGLGLAIIYGIVKMHQGQITVQSEVGRGTTFTIALRQRLAAPSQVIAGDQT